MGRRSYQGGDSARQVGGVVDALVVVEGANKRRIVVVIKKRFE
jgi:hypothetical protein